MSQPSKPCRFEPPHHPGVHDLIGGERHWSSPTKITDAKHGFRGWHERGYLPHHDAPGLTRFVIFYLANSFSETLWVEWEHFFKIEDGREQPELIEAYLDKGRVECHQHQPEMVKLVEANFRLFSLEGCRPHSRAPMRYELGLG